MADISRELQAIMSAIYGEEVRGSIHDAIDKINQVGEVVLSEGTAVTSPTSPTTGFFDGSFYFNTQTSDLWKCTGTGWLLVGNLEGAGIASIVLTSTSGLVDTYTITLTNGNTSTFDVTNGYSPTVTIGTKVGRDQPVTITDEDGNHTFHVYDGLDGTGDMEKSVYDTDNDGKVDAAETADTATNAGHATTADSVSWTGVQNVPYDNVPTAQSNNLMKSKDIKNAFDDMDELIAPIETSPSTHAYAVDKQLFYNGVLYKVIDDIAIGDTLVVNTNIEAADDISTQIANAGKGSHITTTVAQYEALPVAEQEDPDKFYWLGDAQGADYDNIRDIVAPTEYSTAVDDHAVGDEFILGDYLYKAISAITEGDTITPGTNAALAGTIVSQLKALFADETVLKKVGDRDDTNTYNTTPGIRVYGLYTNAAHTPDNITSWATLIEIQRDSGALYQLFIKYDATAIYIRYISQPGQTSSWPTTGNYGWEKIYPAGYLTVKKKTLTATPSSNGNLSTGLPISSTVILAAYANGTDYICIPAKYNAADSGASWGLHVTNAYATPQVITTQQTFTIIYCEYVV